MSWDHDEEEEEVDHSAEGKRRRKAKLYSFNRALRSNNLLKKDLEHNEKQMDREQHRRRKMTDHVKAVMSLKTKHVESTSSWMNNHLNKCLLILERGRHMQVVKPYFHAPGKPLTPYHKKKEKQKAEEEEKRKLEEPKTKSVFLRFKEPARFSHARDNYYVISKNKKYNGK